jgi:hypothetical protein
MTIMYDQPRINIATLANSTKEATSCSAAARPFKVVSMVSHCLSGTVQIFEEFLILGPSAISLTKIGRTSYVSCLSPIHMVTDINKKF